MLISMFNKTDVREIIKGTFVLCLAKKKAEKTLIRENAGNPIAKQNKAFAEFVTLNSLKEPYPNKEDIISSEAMSNASAAGILKNKLNSRALF